MEAAAGSPPSGGAVGTSAPSGQQGGGDPFAERPELFVGGAFVGGLALAILLKRLSS
jgi:hypothetical protein